MESTVGKIIISQILLCPNYITKSIIWAYQGYFEFVFVNVNNIGYVRT